MPRTGRDEAPHGAGQEESMEDGAQEQAAQQPQQESGETQEKDCKALYEEAVKESRKWEKRSKESGVRYTQGWLQSRR